MHVDIDRSAGVFDEQQPPLWIEVRTIGSKLTARVRRSWPRDSSVGSLHGWFVIPGDHSELVPSRRAKAPRKTAEVKCRGLSCESVSRLVSGSSDFVAYRWARTPLPPP